MKKSILLCLTILLFSISLIFAQHAGINNAVSHQDPSTIKGVKSSTASPTPKVIEAEQFSISQPLRDMVSTSTTILAAEEGESDRKKIEYPNKETALPKGPDQAWQKEMGSSTVKWNPTTNFEGIANGVYEGSIGTTQYGEIGDYTFNPEPKLINEWTGASNSYWNQPANWSLGHVPTADEDVIINNVGFQPPIITSVNEECNNLTINAGAGVYVMGSTLTTNGNMTIFGQLSMVDDNGGIICHGNVDWNNNSTANFTANSLFQVYGHWFFNSGANAQLNNGTVNFIGNNLSEVKSKSATCSFNNIYIDKNYNALKIISDANQPLVINGDIGIQANSGFSNDSQQDIICRGNLYNSGYYYLSDVNKLSTFIFDGTNQFIFMFSANGFFNHLKISPSVSVTLGGGIHTEGDLIIESGILDTQGNNIIVEGDWANNVGPDAFIESTGRGVF
jgi:hypothetical protein